MEKEIKFACYALATFKKHARSLKDSNNLIAKYLNVTTGDRFPLEFCQTGSFLEGFPDLLQSDVDWMVNLNPLEIITADWQDKVFKPVEHAPAHVEIQIPVVDVHEFKKTFPAISQFFNILHAPKGKVSFISAQKARSLNQNDFLPDFMKHSKPSTPWENPENEETSPSYSFQNQEMKNITVDRVPALQCKGWPKVAREWIDRERYWPADSLVEKISSGDFYVVPKPSSTSGDHENEWRLSFSFAEAELLHNFGDIQVRVYYILRTLYVKYLKERVKGTLSSYNIKTTFLYMLQDHKPDFWSEENTVAIIDIFFKRLHQYLKEGFCPHYFIPKHNLLYKISRTDLDKSAHEISVLIADPASALNKITEKGFLGMLPRFGLWDVELKSRVLLKLMELPLDEAYSAITSKSERNFAHCKTIEQKCFVDILHETACAIEENPKTDRFVNINLPLINFGYQKLYATKQVGSVDKFKESKMERILLDFEQMNKSIFVWLELCRIALLGEKTKLITNKNVTIVKIEGNTVNLDMKLFCKVCSIVSSFLASPNQNAKENYKQLLVSIDRSLPSSIEGCLQEKDLNKALFVFAGGTCQMANER